MSAWSRDAIAEFFAEDRAGGRADHHGEYAKGCEVRTKEDSSPVTVADEKAEEVILALLRARAIARSRSSPRNRWRAATEPRSADNFILVDPLDGTREFIACNGEFTINIALVRDGSAGRGRGLCAGFGTLMVRRRARLRLRRRRWRAAARPNGLWRQIATRGPRAARFDRAGEPFALRPGDRGFSGEAAQSGSAARPAPL